nr:hypothetical protein [Tanacetum cinerariifolium]
VLNELKHNEKASTSYEYSHEIESLKHTLSDYLKEKESFEQKITIFKDDFQKEESRNIDRELPLEKEALGFQNPRYLKKAQQLKPNLYNGSIIGKSDVMVVPDSENTLMHAEESQLKMIKKQNDPQMIEKKELPKVSMVNSCLKKLKFHLVSFDVVVKERTTATAITEGTWGFEHTKACFRDDIIPFVKNLKELFTSFDKCLIYEVTEVQNIFKQMELAVEQHCAEKTKFQTKMENVLKENDRLLTQALSVEIVNTVVHDCMNVNCLNMDAGVHCITTESELKPDFIKKECYETLLQQYHILETHSQIQEKDTVILKLKAKLKSFTGDVKERKVEIEVEEIETQNLELDHKEKVLVITALKEHLKGKAVLTEAVSLNPIDPALLQVDVAPLVYKLRKNRTAHIDYIRHTQEEASTFRELVESERLLSPLNTSLAYACNTKKDRI